MPTLKLRFPGGRYHATPWGHHVNEGLIEWPPSPWRLLRALIASGFSSQNWTAIPPVAQQLVNKLANVLPSYQLPEASAAHTRHYMPYIEGKAQKTTLVFDTWANVGDGELLVHWPCELSEEESALLDRLVTCLGYLGRSESWVDAELTGDDAIEWNAEPCRSGDRRGREWEQTSVMAAIEPQAYEDWRESTVHGVLQPFAGQRQTAAVKKKQEKAVEPYPENLLSCLTKDTVWWKGHGWSQPPGSQRVLYWRRSNSLEVSVPPLSRSRSAPPVSMMLLAISTPSGRRSALPSVVRTLPQAELFHRAVIGRLGNGQQVDCPELTGKDEDKRPLKLHHDHAHTIPVDLDGDDRLDHVIVYAKMQLREDAQRAIRTLRRTWTKGGVGDLQLAVAGSGELGVLRQLPGPFKHQVDRILGPPEGARVWESITPFVPPRFLKSRGKNTLLGQLNAEAISRQLPEIVSCEVQSELTKQLRHYVCRRSRGSAPPAMSLGLGVRVRFSEPIQGPLLLGYASHYGLGLMAAVD